jgi:hypothetical protein
MDTLPPNCTFCGKKIGPALFNCPYRPGSGCPFEMSASPPISKGNAGCMVGVLLFLIVWLAIATVGFGTMLRDSRSIISSLFSVGALGCFWAFGLFGLSFVLFGLFGKNVALHNHQSGAMAKSATILGLPVGGGVSNGWEPLPPELSRLELPQSLSYPVSLSAWLVSSETTAPKELAAYICEAVLLGFVAQNLLLLKATTSRDTLLGLINRQTKRLLLTPNPDAPQLKVEGYLEQKILKVFTAPPPSLQLEAWIPGTPVEINHLIAAIYDKDHFQPEKWLVDLVETNLIDRGLARKEKAAGLTGRFRQKISLHAASQPQLEAEYRLIRARYQQLKLSQPDFFHVLRANINRAFKDRTESSD